MSPYGPSAQPAAASPGKTQRATTRSSPPTGGGGWGPRLRPLQRRTTGRKESPLVPAPATQGTVPSGRCTAWWATIACATPSGFGHLEEGRDRAVAMSSREPRFGQPQPRWVAPSAPQLGHRLPQGGGGRGQRRIRRQQQRTAGTNPARACAPTTQGTVMVQQRALVRKGRPL